MNKVEFSEKLSGVLNTTKAQARANLDAVLAIMVVELQGGGDLTFQGFGTFSVKKVAARNGRNPQTGAALKIKARKKVHFKPSKNLL